MSTSTRFDGTCEQTSVCQVRREFTDTHPSLLTPACAQLFLSSYILAGTIMRIVYRSIAAHSRHPLSTAQIASFSKLQTRNKVQVVLILVTALCALYLFAHLEGGHDDPERKCASAEEGEGWH